MRRLLILGGALLMALAVVGALTDKDVRPVGHLAFLAAVLAVHDALLLPLAVGVGVLIGRHVPVVARTAVQVAGLITVTLLVVAVPLMLGFGRRADNPSALPLNYGRGFGLALLLVWTVAAIAVLVKRRLTRRTEPPPL
jgi:hypothetical protein